MLHTTTGGGGVYFKLEQYEAAILDFDQAIQLDPRNATFHGWRASAHRKLGDMEEARSDEAKACSLDKNHC